jgi:hypothetical protein
MKNKEKLYQKIRLCEQELLLATPVRAAKLVTKLNRWKGSVFD